MERTTMKRNLSKELKDTIQKRNFRLQKFWEKLGLEVEIIGDMETPAVIKGDYCLACYVHNFNLIFTDHFDQGNEVYRVKLQNIQEFEIEPILNWLKTATHRRVYKIKMKQSPELFLVGYNFKSKSSMENDKYPVYGKHGAKVYFTEDYAKEILDFYHLDYCEIV
jgi:hypothetical protein